MVVEQLAAVACMLLLCWYFLKTKGRLPNSPPGTRHPPCLPALPLVGSLPFLKQDPTELAHQLMEKSKSMGSVFAMYFASRYVVVLNGTASIRDALIKKSSNFAGRIPLYIEERYLNTNLKGVLNVPYDDAFRRKHQLYLSILKQVGFGQNQMETQINAGVEQFIMRAKETQGRTFDPTIILKMSILSIITSIMFGDRFPYGHPTLTEISGLIYNWMLSVVLQIDFFPFLRFVPPYRGLKNWAVTNHHELLSTVDSMLSGVVTAEKFDVDDGNNNSFIRQFINLTKNREPGKPTTLVTDHNDVEPAQLGVNFDREELLYTVRDMLGAGTDTSVTTLRWFLIEMANNHEKQTRMQKEIDAVVGRDRLPSMADEKWMPYSQAVMLESMRRRTIVPLSLFHSTTCDTSVGDLYVPAGAMVC